MEKPNEGIIDSLLTSTSIRLKGVIKFPKSSLCKPYSGGVGIF